MTWAWDWRGLQTATWPKLITPSPAFVRSALPNKATAGAMDASLRALHDAFTQTLAPQPVGPNVAMIIQLFSGRRSSAAVCRMLQELIKQAEAYLKQAATQPGYGILVLKASAEAMVQEPSRRRRRGRLCATARPLLPTLRAVCPAQLIATEGVPLEVRQAAAVNFKNHIKYHWVRAWRPAGHVFTGPQARPTAGLLT